MAKGTMAQVRDRLVEDPCDTVDAVISGRVPVGRAEAADFLVDAGGHDERTLRAADEGLLNGVQWQLTMLEVALERDGRIPRADALRTVDVLEAVRRLRLPRALAEVDEQAQRWKAVAEAEGVEPALARAVGCALAAAPEAGATALRRNTGLSLDASRCGRAALDAIETLDLREAAERARQAADAYGANGMGKLARDWRVRAEVLGAVAEQMALRADGVEAG